MGMVYVLFMCLSNFIYLFTYVAYLTLRQYLAKCRSKYTIPMDPKMGMEEGSRFLACKVSTQPASEISRSTNGRIYIQ